MLKEHPHTPAHLFIDDTSYFITSAIYNKRRLLVNSELKSQLLTIIQESFQLLNWKLDAWVILDNHYHVIATSRKGTDLSKIMGRIHSYSGTLIRKVTHCELPVWWNYWDYCPRNEKDYFTRLNYLLMNPIKHGYVDNLNDYPFSSFHQLKNEVGRETCVKQFKTNPEYKQLVIEEDEF
jgi:putative transposase